MTESTKIRVRFAPSPTGYLHVGGARTALFNYLFAQHNGGDFLLRIEDTDINRSDKKMTELIFDGLKWLGIVWDGDPVFQSNNTSRHREVCEELLSRGSAYRCFCTQEELNEKRKAALSRSGEYRYDRKCMNLSGDEIKDKIEKGVPHVYRFRVVEGETVFNDMIRGNVTVQNSQIDDFIILRSDGTPVYQIAVVVDDHDMRITHVIRGDDHLSNTPKQIMIYKAMGWNVPHFAHVPMILGPDRKRLSKRHGATSIEEYRDAGILPEAFVNFLALLGWSPGDNREIMTIEEIIRMFSLDRVSKNPAVWDEDKLVWINGQHINRMDDRNLLNRIAPLLIENDLIDEDYLIKEEDYLLKFVRLLKSRMKRISDFVERGYYFFKDPSGYEEKAVSKYWMRKESCSRLERITESLNRIVNWKEAELEKVIRGAAEQEGVGAGHYIHPLRLAITGFSVSPSIFELMEVLGKDRVIRRLERAVGYIKNIEEFKTGG